jgi:hypothetical protein
MQFDREEWGMKLDEVLDQLKESNSDDWTIISTQKKMSFNEDINISIANDVRPVHLSQDAIPKFIVSIAHQLEPKLDVSDLDAFSVSIQYSVLYYGLQAIKEFRVYKVRLRASSYYIPEPRQMTPLQFRNKWLIRILNSNKQLKLLFDTFDGLEPDSE